MRRAKKTLSKPHQHPKTIKLILVKWRDATHQTHEDEGEIGTMIVWTLGFEVYRNKKEVALCMEVHEDGSKRDISTIPRPMVLHIKTLARIPLTCE